MDQSQIDDQPGESLSMCPQLDASLDLSIIKWRRLWEMKETILALEFPNKTR